MFNWKKGWGPQKFDKKNEERKSSENSQSLKQEQQETILEDQQAKGAPYINKISKATAKHPTKQATDLKMKIVRDREGKSSPEI